MHNMSCFPIGHIHQLIPHFRPDHRGMENVLSGRRREDFPGSREQGRKRPAMFQFLLFCLLYPLTIGYRPLVDLNLISV